MRWGVEGLFGNPSICSHCFVQIANPLAQFHCIPATNSPDPTSGVVAARAAVEGPADLISAAHGLQIIRERRKYYRVVGLLNERDVHQGAPLPRV